MFLDERGAALIDVLRCHDSPFEVQLRPVPRPKIIDVSAEHYQ